MEVEAVVAAIRAAKAPVIVSGGGVLYSGAEDLLADFAARRNIPVVETQAGKGASAWQHPMSFGSPGVTGSACGNAACEAADLVIGVGTRFQGFPTGAGPSSPTRSGK